MSEALPLLADALDQLEREDRLAEAPLGSVALSELLGELNAVGPQRADRLLEDAELPPDVSSQNSVPPTSIG